MMKKFEGEKILLFYFFISTFELILALIFIHKWLRSFSLESEIYP